MPRLDFTFSDLELDTDWYDIFYNINNVIPAHYSSTASLEKPKMTDVKEIYSTVNGSILRDTPWMGLFYLRDTRWIFLFARRDDTRKFIQDMMVVADNKRDVVLYGLSSQERAAMDIFVCWHGFEANEKCDQCLNFFHPL